MAQSLLEDAAFIRLIRNNLFVFLGVLDSAGTVVEANEASLEASGITLDDVRGKPFWDCCWWNYADDVRAQVRHACMRAAKGEIVRYDARMCTVGESRITVDFRIIPLRDSQGNITHLIPSGVDIAEREHTEAEVRRSEEHFRTVAEGMPHCVWMTDPEGFNVYHNRRWYEYTGAPPGSGRGRDWLAHYHPDDRAGLWEKWTEAVQGAGLYALEARIRRYDGEYRWFRIEASPINDESGATKRYVGTCTDIHDTHQLLDALRESERHFHLALRGANAAVWSYHVPSGNVFWDEEFRSLYGYEAAAPQSYEQWIGSIHPEDRARVEADFQTRIASRETIFRQEFRILHPQRRERRILDVGQIERDAQGRALRCHGIQIDITDHTRAEEALRRSEKEYRGTFENAAVGMANLDMQGRWLRVNERLCRIVGYSRDELLGREMRDDVHPDDLEACLALLDEVGRGERESYQMEKRIYHRNGSIVWINLTLALQRDNTGQPMYIIAIIEDITARKFAEDALKRARQGLEQRVAERTQELRHRAEQLARLTSELGFAEHRERQRLAMVLHDHVQQLLVGAKLRLESISRTAEESQTGPAREATRLLEEAIAATRSLAVELAPPVLYDAGMAAGLRWLAQWMKSKHGLTVHLQLDDRAAVHREDVRVLLFQAVRELLLNVVKHAGVNEATVELCVLDADQVQIVVSDRGRGLDSIATLQGDAEERAGFGLFSIRERITLLGGRFQFDAIAGDGCRFTLIAPARGKKELSMFQLLP